MATGSEGGVAAAVVVLGGNTGLMIDRCAEATGAGLAGDLTAR